MFDFKPLPLLITLFLLNSISSESISQEIHQIPKINSKKVHNHWEISLVCSPARYPCSFQYIHLPQKWLQSQNKLIVPINHLQQNQQLILIAEVTDGAGQTSIQQLKFIVDDIGIKLVSIQPQPYKTSTGNPLKNGFASKDENSLKLKNQQGLTQSERKHLVPFLPTLAYFQNIISSSGPSKISKVLSNILAEDSQCEEKEDYLESISQLMRKDIKGKNRELKNQQRLAEQSVQRIKNLKFQYASLQNELTSTHKLTAEELKQKQRTLQFQKSLFASRAFSLSVVASRYLQKIEQTVDADDLQDKQIEILSQGLEEEKQKISQIDAKIAALIKEKKEHERKLESYERKISSRKSTLLSNNDKVSDLKQRYEEYTKQSYEFKEKVQKTQEAIAIIQEELKEPEKRVQEIKKKMNEIATQIQERQKQNKQNSGNLKETLAILERDEEKISKVLQQCKKKTQPKTKLFERELKKFQINIFSAKWIVKYGVPSTTSFFCNREKMEIQGQGIVTAMGRGSIRVRDYDGQEQVLYLGLCSKLYSIGSSFIPQVGDHIEWEGSQVTNGVSNIFKGTFIQG